MFKAMYKDNIGYMLIFYLLIVGTLILAIPTIPDKLIGDRTTAWFIYAMGLVHVGMLMYISFGRLEYYSKLAHYLGIAAMFSTAVLVISFLFYLVDLVIMIRAVISIYKYSSYDWYVREVAYAKRNGIDVDDPDYPDEDDSDYYDEDPQDDYVPPRQPAPRSRYNLSAKDLRKYDDSADDDDQDDYDDYADQDDYDQDPEPQERVNVSNADIRAYRKKLKDQGKRGTRRNR